jgi:predicted glutamine amidotransferase
MCRWLAYSGPPLRMEDLLYRQKHSLIDQSLHSTLGAETTNGDGFRVGWYGAGETPGVFHSVEPARNNRNPQGPSYGVVYAGPDELRSFAPRAPFKPTAVPTGI